MREHQQHTPSTPRSAWALHLAQTPADPVAGAAAPRRAPLTAAEAERVQRHRDQLMGALRAQDRLALLCAKQQVLEAAFRPRDAARPASAADSPALRQALRDLSWHMAGLLLPRRARHGTGAEI
ncbi:hypothetical protein CLU85_4391 [Acidovorax sp. 69]|uniref:hypothetical protein n=1 Tax=Acidovorax sp. 69 TaxID=2035202 RepID=UPI000CC1B412|nr:hypothetical protein [Acidovorax sp. 69]PJI99539.1 hypothetical protein CLU85_4391 [Acidovorax sp. 69]